ncbi:MAG TPA: DUF2167 domain-containing protein [Myxococcota bacterium]|jgi:uncharacterized membrane-anchored protein
MKNLVRALLVSGIATFPAGSLWAQEPELEPGASEEAEGASAPAAPGLPWQAGPATAPVGSNLAEIELPDGYVYLDRSGTVQLLKLTGNLTGESEQATVAKGDESGWFVIFEWDASGWVDDSDHDELDADGLLASLREGNEAANEERRTQGLPEMTLVGWREPPHYDPASNNLTWAIEAKSPDGVTVNRLTKLLGRRGVMTATLVASPEELGAAQAEVDTLLAGYRFRPGSTYAEYLPDTDQAAGYGLGALVVGGVLAKTGLLAKFWKLIVAGAVASAGFVRRLFRGRQSDTPTA